MSLSLVVQRAVEILLCRNWLIWDSQISRRDTWQHPNL